MILLKLTKEIRAENETEAKNLMEQFRRDAAKDGYRVLSCGYTHKEKKSKGEVIDSCEIVKCVMEYSTVWEGLE